MFTINAGARQHVFHFVRQQHVIHCLTTVTRFGTDLLTVGDVIRHGVAVEPQLALHGQEIAGKA